MHLRILTLIAASCLAVITSATTAAADDRDRRPSPIAGAVYTASNAATGNAVLIFDQLYDGRLVPAGRVSTRGNGTGAGLGNQGGVTLSRNERWLLVVNAGSHSLSVLAVQRRGLRLVDVEPTGGVSADQRHRASRPRLRRPRG